MSKVDHQNCLKFGEYYSEPTPALTCVDSQSVKMAPRICEYRGLDAHKLVNGRKRQFLVYAGERIWAAHVHAAHRHDSTGALALLPYRTWWPRRLQLVLTEAAYCSALPSNCYG